MACASVNFGQLKRFLPHSPLCLCELLIQKNLKILDLLRRDILHLDVLYPHLLQPADGDQGSKAMHNPEIGDVGIVTKIGIFINIRGDQVVIIHTGIIKDVLRNAKVILS